MSDRLKPTAIRSDLLSWVKLVKIIAKMMCVFLILTCAGCATGIPPGPNWDTDAVLRDCSRYLSTVISPGPGEPNPNMLFIAFATVFSFGGNIMGYETCKHFNTLHPASNANVSDGVYHSDDGAFSVTIPEPLKTDAHNPTGIWHGVYFTDMVLFPPATTDGTVYYASVYPKLYDKNVSLTPQEFASDIFTKNGAEYLDVRGVSLRHLYEESLTLNGEPAVFEVYEEYQNNNRADTQPSTTKRDAPIFLLYWVIKTSKHAARLTVAWPGNCPKCSIGPEVEIRKMTPGITTFVDSFKFTDVH